eukprot:GHVL01019900.1.p1 GENE.GHVL01019900.1~~GHVL01019900.1.p1  ORF type:complete len:442 (+),score=111.85 GHVL01019900.1:68-1393(+)
MENKNNGKKSFNRIKVRNINKDISDFGERHQLKEAIKAFNRCGENATVHTYTNIINSCIRCGDIKKSKKYFNEMINMTKIKPNIVTYTVMIKGLLSIGDIISCINIIRKINTYNIRFTNTFLRGCCKIGCIIQLWKYYNKIIKPAFDCSESESDELVFDIYSCEYIIYLLVCGLHLDKAKNILNLTENRFKTVSPETQLSLARSNVSLSRGYALIGEFKIAVTYLNNANNLCKLEEDNNKLFFNHQLSETKRRIDIINSFINSKIIFKYNNLLNEYLIGRFFWFGKNDNDDPWGSRKEVLKVLEQLVESCGVGSCLSMTNKPIEHQLSEINARLTELLDFKNQKPSFNEALWGINRWEKINIELCSGGGDWIVGQAQNFPNILWIAVEIKFDKCHMILEQIVFKQVKNLIIIGADGAAFLSLVSSSSINNVTVFNKIDKIS